MESGFWAVRSGLTTRFSAAERFTCAMRRGGRTTIGLSSPPRSENRSILQKPWNGIYTHTSCDYIAGCTRVVCHPKSYGPQPPGGRIENEQLDENLVIEI